MSPLRPQILAAKQQLAEGHARLKERHRAGDAGVDVCRAGSDLRDEVLRSLFEAALGELEPEHAALLRTGVAFVAHGGYGRREVSPYSDVDLMLLCSPTVSRQVAPLAERRLCDVFDVGLVLGHSVRTPQEACQLALADPQICTSLIEARLLEGNADLFGQFQQGFHRRLRRHAADLLAAIEKARWEERVKFGETVYLLEPNVKRSRGGLRDLQLLRWTGAVRYGTPEPEALAAAGVLSGDDAQAIQRANEFLLRLRNELHFHAGKPGDVLDRAEQLRIADVRGYEESAGLLKVEQFMRDYFRHTAQASSIVTRFAEKAKPRRRMRNVLNGLLGHTVEGRYRVGPLNIAATRPGAARLRSSLAEIMHLVNLASLYQKEISPETWEVVRQAVANLPPEIPAEAMQHFRSLLGQSPALSELLRGLHEVALLERFIPGFVHARGLLQFNQYHKYTVDEHCLLAVQQATGFLDDPGPFGQVYRGIARKHVLHLALLIHDLGKGHPQDHCEVGRSIAEATAARLGLESRDAEALKFLVHRHLLMNHLVFRRDTSDEQLIVRFAVEVGSPELLEMLYVLTAADLAAVGPGSWNNWKAEVITDLYQRTMDHLAGESVGLNFEDHLTWQRKTVQEQLGPVGNDPWFPRQIEALPANYLNGTPPEQIADDLRLLRTLPAGDVNVRADYQPEAQTVRFNIATHENITPGVFHKMAGALTSQGLQILSAQINTLADGLVLDRFRVMDPDYADEPPPERLEKIKQAVVQSLRAPNGQLPTFRRTWKFGGHRQPTVEAVETRVHVDNNTSAAFTILDIFTVDRPGLLYTISRVLFELDLSVSRAKIGTVLDQVVDVFYITDREGQKIHDQTRLDEIRRRLLEALEGMKAE
ncbi:MAG: [protein-PII] uridylyltransferase [Thermoguttaceae bacterium]